MKKFSLFVVVVFVFVSCGVVGTKIANTTPEEKLEIIKSIMVSDATLSSERPSTDILSEQEVMLKAGDYAIKLGALDPSYYLYENDPALLTAKIESPILVYDFTGFGGSDGATYLLNAVNDNGVNLAGAYVRPVVEVEEDSFVISRFQRVDTFNEHSYHHITKREAVNLSRSQFTGKTVSEPVAIRMRLDSKPYSHYNNFWYFTVDDNSRNAVSNTEEYIIDSIITGDAVQSGGVSNRSAISGGVRGSPHLDGARMARLDSPLKVFDKLEAARSAGRSLSTVIANQSMEPVKFTPIPLNGGIPGF
jgi:hypothetical protein